MIERMTDLPDNVLGFSATGTVTGEDYETVLVPAVEAAIAERNKVRLLYHLGPGFSGFNAAAIWDDAKVGLRHLTAWERIAVVTDVDWIRGATKAFGFLFPAEVRVYRNADLPQARAWLSE